jgi:hypothetical protein
MLLAPLASLACTTNDIQPKPKTRIPNHPQRHPLDVVVDLITPTNAAAVSVGVDVTTPHILSNLAKTSYHSIPSITRTHLASICEKLQGRTSNSCQGDEVIAALKDQPTALIPFMVDHLVVVAILRSTSSSTPMTHPFQHHPLHRKHTTTLLAPQLLLLTMWLQLPPFM